MKTSTDSNTQAPQTSNDLPSPSTLFWILGGFALFVLAIVAAALFFHV